MIDNLTSWTNLVSLLIYSNKLHWTSPSPLMNHTNRKKIKVSSLPNTNHTKRTWNKIICFYGKGFRKRIMKRRWFNKSSIFPGHIQDYVSDVKTYLSELRFSGSASKPHSANMLAVPLPYNLCFLNIMYLHDRSRCSLDGAKMGER